MEIGCLVCRENAFIYCVILRCMLDNVEVVDVETISYRNVSIQLILKYTNSNSNTIIYRCSIFMYHQETCINMFKLTSTFFLSLCLTTNQVNWSNGKWKIDYRNNHAKYTFLCNWIFEASAISNNILHWGKHKYS